MLTMNPLPRRRISGSAARVQKNTPSRLVCSTCRQSSTLMSATLANSPTPALLTSTSTPPNRFDGLADVGAHRVQRVACRQRAHGTLQVFVRAPADRDLEAALEQRPRDGH